MSRKGGSSHIKRIAASSYLRINRKSSKYVTKPNPGRHTLEEGMSLITFVKEKLIEGTSREARRIISSGAIYINGKPVKDYRYPVGFGDVVYVKPDNSYYRIGAGRYGTFSFKKIDEKEASSSVFKVVGKYTAKKGVLMLRLHDGTTVKAEKDAKVNDSVVIKGGKIEAVLGFKEGAKCIVYRGIHAPESGTIKSIKKGAMLKDSTLEIEAGKRKFETVVSNIMVVGA
ncbi:MAG: S4 domain-containing protein [Candidatus Micrarchaeia archaeon]